MIPRSKRNDAGRRKEKRFPNERHRKVRISFLPSVFTTFNLLLGYLALLQILKRDFAQAVYFVIIAVVMDGFDGTIARLTKTESRFGMQLDTLVDGVTFGLVTSVMVYVWGFHDTYPQIGRVVGFLFLSAGIMRLARFNMLRDSKSSQSHMFVGIPIPLGAACVLSVVLIFDRPPIQPLHVMLFAGYVLLVAFLMISNIRYQTMKGIQPRHSLIFLFVLAGLIAFGSMYPRQTIPVLTVVYMFSPVLVRLYDRYQSESSGESSLEKDTSESVGDSKSR
ncbi:MAG TPA: CDP-diacylglycerol--serine O-phosphatidyltransferase [Candidatus Aminicenantes bacterium]|nr:CDP-diacylglycerol--serine O-phosphatidyltransferase [Candidatus Aminicenantes bacterium]